MANVMIKPSLDWDRKYQLMQEDSRHEISCSLEASFCDTVSIKEEIRSRKTPPKIPKVFLSNQCIFNCAYCGCRSANDCKQVYQTSPRELAEFSVRVSKTSGTGIFISSAIFKSANYTGELINETLRIIRQEIGYRGYLHAKVMPGTDLGLIRIAGQYADRLSVNIEVAKSEGYASIARNKNKANILTPMGHISRLIKAARNEKSRGAANFATSQTTQLMVGSTGEDDHTILNLSGALYRKYGLSRVYYTAFDFRGNAVGYESLPAVSTPPWRVARLYQADRLMQEYGFTADDLIPPAGNLRQDLDPKANWALCNPHLFPIEVNTADYGQLLKIPGIGSVYAKRILEARKTCAITHDILKSLGVSLKRSKHFILCNGKFTGYAGGDPQVLYQMLANLPERETGAQLYFDLGQVERISAHKSLHA